MKSAKPGMVKGSPYFPWEPEEVSRKKDLGQAGRENTILKWNIYWPLTTILPRKKCVCFNRYN